MAKQEKSQTPNQNEDTLDCRAFLESAGSQGQRTGTADNFYPHYGNYPGEYTDSSGTPLFQFVDELTFNYETPTDISAYKPALQSWYLGWENDNFGSISTPWPTGSPPWSEPPTQPPNFIDFLNWYFYMYQLVDIQIDTVLKKVLGANYQTGGNPSSDTVIIFLSDHGEHGASHGFRGKGGAVYDEVNRIPLYVVLPS